MRKTVPAISPERQLWLVYALLGSTLITSALVIWGNIPRMSAWLLALLALGIGQGLLLPTAAGAIGGLLVVAAWVLLRQTAGIWQQSELVQSLLELAGLSVSVALAVWFRQTWDRDRKVLRSLQPLRTLVAEHEGVSGMVSRQVAELRLDVELARAQAFGHPLGVILFEATPLPGTALPEADLRQVYRAVARQLSNEVRSYDTPFADGANRTGVIMPERGADDVSRQAASIVRSLAGAVFVDALGFPQPVSRVVRLDYGLAVIQGQAVPVGDLLQAAEEHLSASRVRPDAGDWGRTPVDAVPLTVGEQPCSALAEGRQ